MRKAKIKEMRAQKQLVKFSWLQKNIKAQLIAKSEEEGFENQLQQLEKLILRTGDILLKQKLHEINATSPSAINKFTYIIRMIANNKIAIENLAKNESEVTDISERDAIANLAKLAIKLEPHPTTPAPVEELSFWENIALRWKQILGSLFVGTGLFGIFITIAALTGIAAIPIAGGVVLGIAVVAAIAYFVFQHISNKTQRAYEKDLNDAEEQCRLLKYQQNDWQKTTEFIAELDKESKRTEEELHQAAQTTKEKLHTAAQITKLTVDNLLLKGKKTNASPVELKRGKLKSIQNFFKRLEHTTITIAIKDDSYKKLKTKIAQGGDTTTLSKDELQELKKLAKNTLTKTQPK